MAKAEKSIIAVDMFHGDITKHCSVKFIEDWASIELNHEKIDWNNFKGNIVYLGEFHIKEARFQPQTSSRCTLTSSFKYPVSNLL